MIRSIVLSMFLVSIIFVTGCKGTTTTGEVGGPIWFTVHGQGCPWLAEGCTYLDKTGLHKVNWYDDPYFDPFLQPIDKVVFDTDLGFFVWGYGFEGINGIFYDYFTGRAINDGNETRGRDVLSIIGQREEDVIQVNGKRWAAKFNLDAEVGIRVARAANDWNKIAKSRERNENDLAEFTRKITGLEMSEVKSAITSGNQKKINELIETASENWGTSPEQMREIVKSVYGSSFGL